MSLGLQLQGRYIDRKLRNNLLYTTMGGLGGVLKGLIVNKPKTLFVVVTSNGSYGLRIIATGSIYIRNWCAITCSTSLFLGLGVKNSD